MALRFSKRELSPHGRRFFSGLINDKKAGIREVMAEKGTDVPRFPKEIQ